MRHKRFLAKNEKVVRSFRKALGKALETDAKVSVRVEYLDTFDWRLFRAGCRLTRETVRGKSALHWISPTAPPYVLPVSSDIRFAWNLPEGFLKDRLEALIDVRALIPMGAARIERTPGRLVDHQGDSVVRLVVERRVVSDLAGRSGGETHLTVSVTEIPDQDTAYRSVLSALESQGLKKENELADLVAAARVRDRAPGDYVSKPKLALKKNKRADTTLRELLRGLLKTLRANVDGVLEDVDSEFLHDLRVATRRTRSALGQIRGVLHRDEIAPFVREFKWLSTVTGPCRDLDVNLIEMDGFRRQLGDVADALDPLQRLLEKTRRREYLRVCRALRSARFAQLIDEWDEYLSAPKQNHKPAKNAALPISELAGKRILKAYTRMLERGSGLDSDPPPETLHRLRIDAKKLRYLLEFFASLYPKKTVSKLVRELKQVQDILGGFNDMEVQQRRLAELADELMSSGNVRSETVFAMGRLADAMGERQEQLRRTFSEQFASFASEESRKLCRRTFGGN
jgi:CHAD domain-containing protein